MADISTESKLLWLDLEMTGLNPDTDLILEVALILTDFDFSPIVSYEAIVKHDIAKVKELISENDWYQKFPINLEKFTSENKESVYSNLIEENILTLIDQHAKDQVVYIAGNSIYSDRKFIAKFWPLLDKRLHYRLLDVSSFKIIMAEKYKLEFEKNNQHRAMSDIENSIAELKYYLTKFKNI